ncbi:hypothetical protein FGIG_10653 [Fasciola gigantica]|uniref:Uncharacterized protein n=1 Tax=Fasciola gigantica TaxID=46835 RepID=A0A504Z4Y5_FASGI|nr:hypothetical protein FGIG_10653 [Fasciola gigantica]
MAEETENISQSDRLDILKTLLKEQIKANEILKYEFTQLNKLYQVVCAEKSLLVNELLDNHSTCSNALCNSVQTNVSDVPSNDIVPNAFKRSTSVTPCHLSELRSQMDSQTMVKRSRMETYTGESCARAYVAHLDDLKDVYIPKISILIILKSFLFLISSVDGYYPWHQQDEFDEVIPSLTRPRGSGANSPPCTTSNIRNPNSRLQTLATQLNSYSSAAPSESPKAWQHQFNNSCSPPALSSSSNVNHLQRPTKTASLVTSSSVATTGGSGPVVQRVGPSKYLSPTNRTPGLLSSSTLPKANLVINASLSGGSGSAVGLNQKPLSQVAPAYRLSCSSTGQRILIQPSEHGRQIRIQQPENRISNLADESH